MVLTDVKSICFLVTIFLEKIRDAYVPPYLGFISKMYSCHISVDMCEVVYPFSNLLYVYTIHHFWTFSVYLVCECYIKVCNFR